MKVLVVGYKGEIGRAIMQLVSCSKHVCVGVEKGERCSEKGFDVMHVCIPGFLPDFVETVKNYQLEYQPQMTIIESTVPVGTTRLFKNAVHSPVRGKHPNLFRDLKRYKKFVGTDDGLLGDKVAAYYHSLGLRTRLVEGSRSTELLKLLNTTYFGLLCAWFKETSRLCEHFSVPYQAWEDFVKSTDEFVPRPFLYPPKEGFGGHCVWENAVLLRNQVDSKFADLVVDVGKKQEGGGVNKVC